MSEAQVNSVAQGFAGAHGTQTLSTEEMSHLLLASSLSATRPLVGLMNCLINEGKLDRKKLKSFLTPILVTEGLPPATRAMLDPIWKALLHQLDDSL